MNMAALLNIWNIYSPQDHFRTSYRNLLFQYALIPKPILWNCRSSAAHPPHSTCQSLPNQSNSHHLFTHLPLIINLIKPLSRLLPPRHTLCAILVTNQGGQVKFMWVPAHIGLSGNERADKLAKRALKKGDIEMRISISKAEVKSMNWENVNQSGKIGGTQKKRKHLYVIQKSVEATRVRSWNRREETVLTRLRLGHTALNRSLKMIGKRWTGLCEGCGGKPTSLSILTV